MISERINSNVNEYCGTTHTEDVASAQAVFAGYCALDAGTTSFASPSYLKGKVTVGFRRCSFVFRRGLDDLLGYSLSLLA